MTNAIIIVCIVVFGSMISAVFFWFDRTDPLAKYRYNNLYDAYLDRVALEKRRKDDPVFREVKEEESQK